MKFSFKGHLLALIAVLIWGMTFIASKVLVGIMDPYWLIVIRFILAWGVLFLLSPKPLPLLDRKTESSILLCGLLGITLYYIFQNAALVHSTAANTGVISSASPLVTALVLYLFGRRVRLSPLFFLGCALCVGGIAVLSWGGGGAEMHLLGDFFAVLAMTGWGLYCVLILRTGNSGLSELQITRKIFFWGTLFCIPLALLLGEWMPLSLFLHGGLSLWGNLLFVAVLSSAVCYLFWGQATTLIGAVTTSVYMYLMPVVTVIGSAILLHERVTAVTVLSIAAILGGLILCQKGNAPTENAP